jgi:hypothetical protein
MENDGNQSAKYLNDVRSTDELIELALSKDADRDDDDYWQPIAVLQHRLSTILERIQILAKNNNEKCRDAAATILGQSRVRNKFSPEICAEILLPMLKTERSDEVLSSIIFALGHLHTPSAITPLVKLRSHSNPSIRYAVVSSLCGHGETAAVDTLIELSADIDRDVRNWATFGLGSQIDVDTSSIREALHKRLVESDDEIRGEALVGLARRGDFRAAEALLAECDHNDSSELRDWLLFQEAVEEIVSHADTGKWLPALNKMAELKIGEADEIKAAIERCK